MEWVETTAKTVEEAKELALDQLGVDEADAEFEVLDEPRPGLFGRTRGEARVRARVRPTQARPKVERRDRRRKGAREPGSGRAEAAEGGQSAEPAADRPAAGAKRSGQQQSRPASRRAERPNQSASNEKTEKPVNDPENAPTAADVAAEAEKFLQGLLAALGLEGRTAVNQDGEDLEVTVEGDQLGVLIGPRGTTLLAVQDLVRVASQRRIGDHQTRLRLDISGYREKRRAALARFALEQADAVAESGEERVLEPMPSADRKVIHDAIGDRTDVVTRSEGEEPRRRVVIAPASAG